MNKFQITTIYFVVPSLSSGGAEKVLTFLAKSFNNQKYKSKLIVIGFQSDTVYDTNGIDILYLNKKRVSQSVLDLYLLIRKNRPDIVFGTLSHINSLLGLISFVTPKTKFIGRETIIGSTQKDHIAQNGIKSSIFNIIAKIGHKGLDTLVCQSKDMQIEVLKRKLVAKHKLAVINNPIQDGFKVKNRIPAFTNNWIFITVASLAKRKGHLRILEALKDLDIDFIYKIIGSGEELENIMKTARLYNLEKKIEHIPFTTRINELLMDSHLYLQGSYVEGFPNALVESLATGTPAVVFKAPGGINEIMINNVNGFIVSESKEMESKILKITKEIDCFKPEKVSSTITYRLNKTKILQQYDLLFAKLIAK
ncbi:glycosyltransferase [Croceivirga radicis]|uniref:glycosyltransferase n=1 Tax=Croceivirga radicis TaxID=1929488 RepID=UPI0015958678|nr:glycosyltransferase [Croceivirga radicis]